MKNKDTLVYRLGDGLMPDPYRTKLYQIWFTMDLASDVRIELNYWSWMHFLSGMVFALLFPKATFLIWFIIHCIWELYQIAIGMSDICNNTKTEFIDISFDTIFAMIGWLVMTYS